MTGRRLLAAIVALLLVAAAPAGAAPNGSGSAAAAGTLHSATKIADQAKAVEYRLAAAGARIAIVGRIGRDPATMPQGLRYTHVAFWRHTTIRTAEGDTVQGYAVHNLYQTDDRPDRSTLTQDFPVDFMAPTHDLTVGIILPVPAMQQRLLAVLDSPVYARLHNPRYSVIANPVAGRFQNCTSFVLDVVMAALYRTDDPTAIRANVAAYFRPQAIEVSGGRRLLASLFVRDVATSDHGPVVRTATFETLAAFMTEYGLAAQVFEMPPPAGP